MAIPNGVNSRRAYPEEHWEAMKPRIVHFYIDEGYTLDRTMDALRAEGFHATEKMYKTRIKKWNLKKYIKDEDAAQILQAEAQAPQDGGLHRHHTIGGRAVTTDDARRHLKRKKIKTWGGSTGFTETTPQPELLTPVIADRDDELITSPIEDGPYIGGMFPRNEWYTDDTTVPITFDEDVVMDEAIDEVMEEVERPELAVTRFGNEVSPNLLLTPGLAWATQSFLFGMRDFADQTMFTGSAQTQDSLANGRFNKLWDLFCTSDTLQRNNENMRALTITRQAQGTFQEMLLKSNPWLIISLCLLLNDHMSNPDRAQASKKFLARMAQWANETHFGSHPIAELIQFLQQTNDHSLELLEATVRMLTKRLNETVGPHHGVSLELSRLHSRIMTEIGMHATAERLLAEELAEVEHMFGSSSLQNLLRLSSLARAKFIAEKYHDSLRLYMKILSTDMVNQALLADIKYGAMYFVAKSNAKLGNVDLAIAQTREALKFSIETKGEDHYWANNAKELINELETEKLIFVTEID